MATSQATPPFVCRGTSDYTFCTSPMEGQPFFLAVSPNPSRPQALEPRYIQDLLKQREKLPRFVLTPPREITVASGARVYQVNDLLPESITSRNGRRDEIVGPNCYQAALSAAGYKRLEGTYVDSEEFAYYLKRDFEPGICADPNSFGALAVYDQYPATYDSGDHAAFILLGGLVFEKADYKVKSPYAVRPFQEASSYPSLCYRPKVVAALRDKPLTEEDRKLIRIFDFYIAKIEGTARRMREDIRRRGFRNFRKIRLDLMTVETSWKWVRDFRDARIGNFNPMEKVLALPRELAESYERLGSLNWQHHAMAMEYDPIKYVEQRRKLYDEKYATFGEDFAEELRLHLDIFGVPAADFGAIAGVFRQKIQDDFRVNRSSYENSDGGRGVPYLDLLTQAIREVKGDGWVRANLKPIFPMQFTARRPSPEDVRKVSGSHNGRAFLEYLKRGRRH